MGAPVLLNDIHSQLNEVRMAEIAPVESLQGIQASIHSARERGLPVAIAGGRHAMGGQQFGTDSVLLDMTPMRRVLSLDVGAGLADVEAGIEWPALIAELERLQRGVERPWTIVQKQTGTDRLSVGGALAANAHGRGLAHPPIIADVESFRLMTADGALVRCSRSERPELFRTAIGGYGLFGVMTSVQLRLMRRRKLQRIVQILRADELMEAVHRRIADGYLYGDFQYAIDPASDHFLRTGILSCYRPVSDSTPIPGSQRELTLREWQELVYLAHTKPGEAFDRYAGHYLSTSGQYYWSDLQQLSPYLQTYHQDLDRRLGTAIPGSEVITELYVPRPVLSRFLAGLRAAARTHRMRIIYGTIRFIEPDTESFLPWATEPFACVIVNLHLDHTPSGLREAAANCRRMIDLAADHGGRYYLTYHRFATREQVLRCYPKLPELLALKRQHDPEERIQSDWYRHYREMFSIASSSSIPSGSGQEAGDDREAGS